MDWFAFDNYTLFRFCGALAILWVIYYLLFDRKARYVHCRYYLLAIVVVSAFAAGLRIPVYPSDQVLIHVPEIAEVHGHPGMGQITEEIKPEEKTEEEVVYRRQIEEPETVETGREVGASFIKDVNLLEGIYIVVTIGLLIRWLLSVFSIWRLKRWGSCSCQEGITIVKNNRVSSPFSFFRMIFINRKLAGETLQIVLGHEKSHIEHKHYRDTLCMELFCILFWFNPFVWLVRRELRAVHEFEVDHCLLSSGLELSKYQNIIFDELMGYGPEIANGFHNSLIKKRFIMMKSTNTIRYRLLRKMVVIPACVGVIALFSFTKAESVRKNVLLPAIPEVGVVEQPIVLEENLPIVPPRTVEHPDADLAKMNCLQLAVSPIDTLGSEIQIFNENQDLTDSLLRPFVGRDGITFYPLREDQMVVSILPYRRQESVLRYIETNEKETRVTIATPIHYDGNWIQFDKGFVIVDRETGDSYMIRSLTRGIELNKTLLVRGKKGRMLEFTMIFPPLKKSVKYVDIYQKFPHMKAVTPSNAGEDWCFKKLCLADYQPPKNKDLYYDEEGRPRKVREVTYQELRSDQVTAVDLPFANRTIITAIVTDKQETRVMIAVPIHYDRHWVQFDKGFCIEDCRNGDTYPIKAVEHGIELNKTLVVVGQKGRMVEFTLVFPPLKKKAKRINLYTKYPEESALTPANVGKDWCWRNVRIPDYSTKIYY